jgi:hypothetical protein
MCSSWSQRAPNGARNHAAGMPATRSTTALPSSRSSTASGSGTSHRSVCDIVWLAITWPSRMMRWTTAVTLGLPVLAPTRKNTARTRYFASASSTIGVVFALGPSSNVNSTSGPPDAGSPAAGFGHTLPAASLLAASAIIVMTT